MPTSVVALGVISSLSVPIQKLCAKPAVFSMRKMTVSPGVTGMSVTCWPAGSVKRSEASACSSMTRGSPEGAAGEDTGAPGDSAGSAGVDSAGPGAPGDSAGSAVAPGDPLSDGVTGAYVHWAPLSLAQAARMNVSATRARMARGSDAFMSAMLS